MIAELARSVLPLISSLDWKDQVFDVRKAYCMASFSKFAYLAVTDEEYKFPKRARIIPCFEHAAYVERGRSIDVEGELRTLDFDDIIIIRTYYFVAIVVFAPKLIVVAVRGTQFLYDWLLNLDVRKISFEELEQTHRGFLLEALKLQKHLTNALNGKNKLSNSSDRRAIYVTGHSLGGAIASILYELKIEYDSRWSGFTGSYVFGCPRYTTLNTIIKISTPFHCRNPDDIVPRVPPRVLGYHGFLAEFDLDGSSYSRSVGSPTDCYRWIEMLISGKIIDPHYMEVYLGAIATAAGLSVSKLSLSHPPSAPQ